MGTCFQQAGVHVVIGHFLPNVHLEKTFYLFSPCIKASHLSIIKPHLRTSLEPLLFLHERFGSDCKRHECSYLVNEIAVNTLWCLVQLCRRRRYVLCLCWDDLRAMAEEGVVTAWGTYVYRQGF